MQENQRKQLNKFLDQNLNNETSENMFEINNEIRNDEERLNAINRKMSTNQMHGKDAESSYFNMDSFVGESVKLLKNL